MKKICVLGMVLAGAMLTAVGCGEDSKSCSTPDFYTQSKKLKEAMDGKTGCGPQAEAISEYVDNHGDELADSFADWSSSKQSNGWCYVRDAVLYLTSLSNYKAVYDGLDACKQNASEDEDVQKIDNALTSLTTLEGWGNVLDAASAEAEKSTQEQ